MVTTCFLLVLQVPSLSPAEAKAADALSKIGGSLEYVLEEKPILSLDVENQGRKFDFEIIKDLKNLGAVRIFHGDLLESSLRHLRTLPKLELLVLLTDGLSDTGLAQICRAKNLNKLDVKSSQLTVRSLDRLRDLPRLRRLFLYNTSLTDADLRPLEKLTNLDELYLPTSVTEPALHALRKKLPRTNVRVLRE